MSDNNRSDIVAIKNTSAPTNLKQFMKNYKVDPIKDLLKDSKTAQVIISQTNIDSVAAGLALAIGLKNLGLQVSTFTPNQTDNNYSKLSGLDMLSYQISKNDLTVTIDHPLDQIEKVSYNDDGGKLNLVVQTKPSSTPIDNQKIIINSGGAVNDINFILGDELSLGQNSDIVSKGNWVVISDKQVDKAWAKAIVIDQSAPYCEMLTFLLPEIGLNIDMDMGKNLLIGLRVATQSFSVNVSPESFEAGAINLKATQPAPGQPDPLAPTSPEGIENKNLPGANQPNPVGSV